MDRKDKKYRSTTCLNCETPLDLSEKFCHSCGQLNTTKKLTIRDFIEEFFANFYAYDSKIKNSIFSLFTKPGVLAREFNEGKRNKYANPFRLFLSISLALFISFNMTEGDATPISIDSQIKNTKEIAKKNRELDSLTYKTIKSETPSKELLDRQEKGFSHDSIYTNDYISKNIKMNFEPLTYTISSFRNFYLKYPQKSSEEALEELGFENSFFYNSLFNKSKSFKTKEISTEIFEYFYRNLPFFIFLSLPILTLLFWMLFYDKKLNYTEHLVFTYTLFTFYFMCMILFNLMGIVSDSVSTFFAGISFLIIFPLYLYKSLRNFYQLSRWKTIFKFILLNPLLGLFLGICIVFIAFIGIILF